MAAIDELVTAAAELATRNVEVSSDTKQNTVAYGTPGVEKRPEI